MTSVAAIDDNLSVLEATRLILEAGGFKPLIARGGQEGLALIRTQQPDIVLCDINMPDMSGYDVLRALRSDPATAAIPVIFLTALSDWTDVRAGMEMGADDYVTKPFSARDIIKAVEAQIAKRKNVEARYESTLHILRKNIAYALPHELRTPLAGILGYAGVLEMDYETLQPPEVLEIAQHILRSGKRLQRVLENYLVYAQLEIMATDPLELDALRSHITNKTARIVTEQAAKKAESVKRASDLVLNVENIALAVSEDNLRKIVEELSDNAFKFSAPGTPVQIGTKRESERFIILFQDQGRGMTAEQIQSVGAYMQFGRMLHEQQGLGLGLIIARRLAELHNARLNIQSEPGRGTQVSVHFPI
jgi:signal transduction histidine kinase